MSQVNTIPFRLDNTGAANAGAAKAYVPLSIAAQANDGEFPAVLFGRGTLTSEPFAGIPGDPVNDLVPYWFVPSNGAWPEQFGDDFQFKPLPGVVRGAEFFRAHPLAQKPDQWYLRVIYKGTEIPFTPVKAELNGAVVEVDVVGRHPDFPLAINARMTLGFDSPFVHVVGTIGWAGLDEEAPEAPLTINPGDVKMVFGRSNDEDVFWLVRPESFYVEGATNMIAPGGLLPFECYAMGEPLEIDNPPEDEHDMESDRCEAEEPILFPPNMGRVFARLDATAWQGHVGPQGTLFNGDDDPGFSELEISRYMWDGNAANIEAPTNTGDRGVFGAHASQVLYAGENARHLEPAIVAGVYYDAQRQESHRGADGKLLTAGEIADRQAVFFNGKPDRRFSQDLLSMESSDAMLPPYPQDEPHLSIDYPLDVWKLTGNFVAEQYVRAKVAGLLNTIPSYVTRERGVGRTLSALMKFYRDFANEEERDYIEAYSRQKEAAVIRLVESSMEEHGYTLMSRVVPVKLAPRTAYDRNDTKGGYLWPPWMNVLLGYGLYDMHKTVPGGLSIAGYKTMMALLRSALQTGLIERESLDGKTRRFDPLYVAGWKGGGEDLTLDEHAELSVEAASRPQFRALMSMAARILLKEDPGRTGPISMLADRFLEAHFSEHTFDSVRYSGAY